MTFADVVQMAGDGVIAIVSIYALYRVCMASIECSCDDADDGSKSIRQSRSD